MESHVKAVIINVARGAWYPKGQQRLYRSLVNHGFAWDIKTWTDFPNFNYNSENPYNVKPSAFEEMLIQGYTHILWLDSSVWAVQNPNKIFDVINERGYYLWKNGLNCAQECSDKCLEYFAVNRDDAEKMPCVSTGVMGVNILHEKGKQFLDRWLQSARDGAFNGSRLHDNQSNDSRFLHHRQDQSCASVIANQMGLHIDEMNNFCSYYSPEMPETVIFAIQGL